MAIAAYRYNNPFDVSLPIAGWNGGGDTVGIQGQPGFGAFPDMATGYKAGVQRLNSYITGQSSHGPKRTIKELNSVYATDPNWAAGVAAHSGLNPDDALDAENADQMRQLQYGVMAQEIGPKNAAQILAQHGGGGGDNPVAAINSAAGIGAPAAGGGALSFAGGAQPTTAASGDEPALHNLFAADKKDDRFSIGSLFGASDDTKNAMHSFGARLTRAAAALSSGVNPHQSSQLNAQAQALEADNKGDIQYMQGANGQLIRINKKTNQIDSIGIPDAQKESFMPVMGKDDNGNPTMTGTFNKSTGEYKPVGGMMASSAGTPVGGDPNLTGQERYDSLTSDEQKTIDAWRNGTGVQPTGLAMRNPKTAKMLAAANAIGIDMQNYGARQAMVRDLAKSTPGSAGGQLDSSGAMIKHVTDLTDDYIKLKNSDGYGGTIVNAAKNAVTPSGSERDQLLKSIATHSMNFSGEVTKQLAGAPGGQEERQRRVDLINQPRGAPSTQAAALEAELMDAINKRQTTLDRVKDTMGEQYMKQPRFQKQEAELEIAKKKLLELRHGPAIKDGQKSGTPVATHSSWEDAQKAGWK